MSGGKRKKNAKFSEKVCEADTFFLQQAEHFKLDFFLHQAKTSSRIFCSLVENFKIEVGFFLRIFFRTYIIREANRLVGERHRCTNGDGGKEKPLKKTIWEVFLEADSYCFT